MKALENCNFNCYFKVFKPTTIFFCSSFSLHCTNSIRQSVSICKLSDYISDIKGSFCACHTFSIAKPFIYMSSTAVEMKVDMVFLYFYINVKEGHGYGFPGLSTCWYFQYVI